MSSINIDRLVFSIILPFVKYPALVILPFASYVNRNPYLFWHVLTNMNSYLPLRLVQLALIYSLLVGLIYLLRCSKSAYVNRYRKPLKVVEPIIIVITGGSSGLGLSIIEECLLKHPSCTIINLDITDCPINDQRLVNLKCDLADFDALEVVIEKIKGILGSQSVDLLICNAAMRTPYCNFELADPHATRRLFQVNTFTPLRLCQSLVCSSKNKSYVVVVSSILGILAPAKIAGYAASKAALTAYFQSLQHEARVNGNQNLKVLLVVTGQLNTSMFAGFEPPRQFFAPILDRRVLALEILSSYDKGISGTLNLPLYTRFGYILMSLPQQLQYAIRRFAGIDTCLPDE